MDIAELGLKIRSDGVVVATDRMKKMEKQTGTLEDSTHRLAKAAGAMAGGLVAAFSIAAVSNYADAWSDMQSRVGAAAKDMEAAPELMRRMVDVANASYSPLEQTVAVYSANLGVLRELGYAAQETADYTESLNHMLVITATRGERAASVQNALSKAMAMGKLTGEGLESVLANGGRVAEALAQELGTTTNGLRDAAAAGKITSQVIAKALLGSLEDVREEAGKMPATITDGITRIQTGMVFLVGTIDQATGASAALSSVLLTLGDGLIAIADGKFAEWVMDVLPALTSFGQVVGILALTQLPRLFAAMATTIATTRAVGVAFMAQYYLTAKLAAATGLLSSALAMVGGPVGIAIGVFAGLGIAYYNGTQRANEYAEAATKTAEAQKTLTSALDEFYKIDTQQSWEKAKQEAQNVIDTLNAQVEVARARVEGISLFSSLGGYSFGQGDWIMSLHEDLQTVENDLFNAQSLMSMLEHAAGRFGQAVIPGKEAVKELTDEQSKALATANEMLLTSQRRTELLQMESRYGANSVGYLATQLRHERDIFQARVNSLDVAQDIKDALMQTWWEEQTAAGVTKEWNAVMDVLKGTAVDVFNIVTDISNTEPGGGWLDTAIGKAETLWSRLADAAAELSFLAGAELDESGNVVSVGERGKSRPQTRPNDGGTGSFGGSSGGGGGGGGGPSPAEQFKKELDQLKQTTASIIEQKNALAEANSAGTDYGTALAILEEKQRLLNQAQEAGVAITPALKEQVNEIATAYVDATEELRKMQEQTQRGEDAFKSLFGAILEGAESAKQAVLNLVLEIAKAQFTSGMMGLLKGAGGGGLISGLGALLGGSYDGGGYTGNGPRSGGVDGKGGFWAVMHPKETVTDHTKGQRLSGSNGNIGIDVRTYMDDDGRWQQEVVRISRDESKSAVKDVAKQMPAAINTINSKNPRIR